jgi:hypothetical protein
MYVNYAGRRDNEALRRLAVILLTLAAIAESVARRSAPVRCLVLWLLGRAEVRARDLAFRTGAGAALASAGSPVCLLGGHGEAARLTTRLRALAAVFFALSRQIPEWLARRHDPVRQSADCRNWPGRQAGTRRLPFTDTS